MLTIHKERLSPEASEVLWATRTLFVAIQEGEDIAVIHPKVCLDAKIEGVTLKGFAAEKENFNLAALLRDEQERRHTQR